MKKVPILMVGSERSAVEIANQEVSIYSVCSLVGMDFQSYYGTSSKLYCPFGDITHMDGGATRAFRVYEETNSAYCWACSQYFNPVSLYAEANDLTREESADALLEKAGWKEETFEEKWEKLVEEKEYDSSNLQEVLNIYCRGVNPDWDIINIQSPYREAFMKCVQVIPRIKNNDMAMQWLTAAKKAMQRVL